MAITALTEQQRIALNSFYAFLRTDSGGGITWPDIQFGDILQAASGGGATPGVLDPYTPPSGTFTVVGKESTQGLVFTGGANSASSTFYINNDNSGNFNFNAPTNDKYQFLINGNAIIQLNNIGIFSPNTNLTVFLTNAGIAGGGGTYGFSDSAGYPALQANGQTVARGHIVAADPTTLNGQLECAHLAGGTATPATPVAGTGAGTGPSGIAITGSDLAGKITITTGTTPATSAVVLTITNSVAFASATFVLLLPATAATAALPSASAPFATGGTSTWTINSNTTALGASTAYAWYYFQVQ